jgi:hypothetical protein
VSKPKEVGNIFSRVIAAVICLISLASESRAQSECDAVLAANTVADNGRKNISLSTLDLITDENYSSFQKQFRGAANLPIFSAPVDISGNYSNFNESRNIYKEEHRFDYKIEEVRNLSVIYISDKAVEAWANCITKEKKELLILRPSQVTDTDLVIQARWYPGLSGADGTLAAKPIVLGAEESSLRNTFPPRWVPLHFKRKSGEAFSMHLELTNGHTPSILISPYSYLLNAPSTCTRATKKGCFACRVNLDYAQLSPGQAVSAACEGMAPEASITADYLFRYSVLSAPSRRTRVIFTVPGGGKVDDNHIDFEFNHNPTQREVQNSGKGLKSNSIGDVRSDITVNSCEWVHNEGGSHINNCAVKIEFGSIKFYLE